MQSPIDELYTKHNSKILALASALASKGQAGVSTITLVNELYIKLHGRDDLSFPSLGQFMAYVSRAMRSHLVDEARRQISQKRNAHLVPLTLGIDIADGGPTPDKIIELDQLLAGLGHDHPRLEQVAEMRTFALMSVGEIATALGVSEPTVKRDWQMVKAYLTDALKNST